MTAVYEGRSDPQEYKGDPSHNLTRGCIIGGSALVDPHLSGVAYPNTVTTTRHTRFLEWKTDELRAAMKEDKSIEAAVLNTVRRLSTPPLHELPTPPLHGLPTPPLHENPTPPLHLQSLDYHHCSSGPP